MKTQAGIEQMILEGFCSAFLYVLKKNVISEYQIKRPFLFQVKAEGKTVILLRNMTAQIRPFI